MNQFFKILNKEQDKGHIQFSSISERLSVIEVGYFEKLFSSCVVIYKKILEVTLIVLFVLIQQL